MMEMKKKAVNQFLSQYDNSMLKQGKPKMGMSVSIEMMKGKPEEEGGKGEMEMMPVYAFEKEMILKMRKENGIEGEGPAEDKQEGGVEE
jgi:hypothetical protein